MLFADELYATGVHGLGSRLLIADCVFLGSWQIELLKFVHACVHGLGWLWTGAYFDDPLGVRAIAVQGRHQLSLLALDLAHFQDLVIVLISLTFH